MNGYFFFWLTVATVTALCELGNPGLFYFLAGACAAVAAALSAIWCVVFEYQIFIFVAVAVGMVCIMKYVFVGHLTAQGHYHSNIYAMQGKHAHVVQTIGPYKAGVVKIGGELWTAYAVSDAQILYEGELVEVVRVAGAHVKVKKLYTSRSM